MLAEQVRGTLVLLPLVFRCRPLGCVYLLAPWDIHPTLGKAASQEMAALLAGGTFRALLAGGPLQAEWYSQVLSEGPMPAAQPQGVPTREDAEGLSKQDGTPQTGVYSSCTTAAAPTRRRI